ncbi:unnamed protein product [Aspergillus oryzae var. brunneus]|uniref:Unnamed protein product n=2 Tax=Aspergillus oryzae TaxID=5062 RepID=A0AAN4YTQ2_ASPOZ|nr:unnamed protein product [Aspergillus oryzae]GMG53842.1 unnamed protein product [Aspergillus oryzae var. brunneus]
MSDINMDDCTLATCPIDLAYINYQPNIPANVLFLVIFGLLLAAQITLGTWFRAWTYMGAMTAGLILEILGYIGRLMMHSNPFDFNAFLLIVIVYGEDISRIRPRTYTILFVTCDIIALVLQAAGGAITSIADSDQKSLGDTGVNIMIAGLAFQVASLTLFIVLASEFALRVRRSSEVMKNASTASVRSGLKWKMFLLCKCH